MTFDEEIIISSIVNLSLKEALKQLPNFEPDIWTISLFSIIWRTNLIFGQFHFFPSYGGRIWYLANFTFFPSYGGRIWYLDNFTFFPSYGGRIWYFIFYKIFSYIKGTSKFLQIKHFFKKKHFWGKIEKMPINAVILTLVDLFSGDL